MITHIGAACLTVIAAFWYAVGFVLAKVVSFLLWCWVAAVQGYKAGL